MRASSVSPTTAGELIDNRRGQPELLASAHLALDAMLKDAGNREPSIDRDWAEGLRRKHDERIAAAGNGGPKLARMARYTRAPFSRLSRLLPIPTMSASPMAAIC